VGLRAWFYACTFSTLVRRLARHVAAMGQQSDGLGLWLHATCDRPGIGSVHAVVEWDDLLPMTERALGLAERATRLLARPDHRSRDVDDPPRSHHARRRAAPLRRDGGLEAETPLAGEVALDWW
jgi:hypothetical protein